MKEIIIRDQPTIFLNKDFQTIQINVTFPFIRKKEDLAFYHVLPNMLQLFSKKYPTEREFSLEQQRLYILGTMCNYTAMGDLGYFTFNLMVPDTYSYDEDVLEKQFEFFSQMIYEPKIKDHSFYCDEFQREVQNLRVSIDKVLKDHIGYAFVHGRELVDVDDSFSYTIYAHPEAIDLIDEKKLYDFYQETVYHNKPLIYVFGNVDKEQITKYCKKYLYRESFQPTPFTFNLEHYLPLRDGVQDICEESQFRNSVYLTFYNIKDMKEEDRVLLETVKNLLTSQVSRLLNKKLRDENDLVYSSTVVTYHNAGVVAIMATINQKNIDIVKEKIIEVLEDLRDEEYVSKYLELLKERYRLSQIRLLDDKVGLFQDYMVKDLGVEITSDEYYLKLCGITARDISTFMDRFVLNTQYFLKEGEHE